MRWVASPGAVVAQNGRFRLLRSKCDKKPPRQAVGQSSAFFRIGGLSKHAKWAVRAACPQALQLVASIHTRLQAARQ